MPGQFMRLLSEADVANLMSPDLAIAAAERAFSLQSSGIIPNPGRVDVRSSPTFRALVMAGLDGQSCFGLKANLHSYPAELPRASGSFLTLWDADMCLPRAFIATAAFNDHRTAAGFAAAAKALNRTKAQTLTVFGAGKIAGPSISYLVNVCSIQRVNVIARRIERAEALAQSMRRLSNMQGVDLVATQSPEKATREADIVVTITTSDTPVVAGSWVRPGALVILGGANRPHAREADDELITGAQLFVDHIEGCLEKAGDIRLPLEQRLLSREHIAGEIGAVIAGKQKFDERPDRISVFKSIGLISQDMLLAEALLQRADELQVGAFYDLYTGTLRQAREQVLA